MVVLVNRHTKAASTIHWTSNKIEKEVYGITTAKTMALQGLTNTIFFVKEVLNEICGEELAMYDAYKQPQPARQHSPHQLTDTSQHKKHCREDGSGSQTHQSVTQHSGRTNKNDRNQGGATETVKNRSVSYPRWFPCPQDTPQLVQATD